MKYLLLPLFLVGCSNIQTSVCSYDIIEIEIKSKVLISETACNVPKQQKGLMNITKLDNNKGMIFVFEKDKTLSFWMKNTNIPLSIAFVDSKLNIVDIKDMKALDETSVISALPATYAIEANKGWFQDNNISIGDKIKFNTYTSHF